jgi:acetylornithine deacetylase/succinyl-diaminopimelate desuccinylase-like protein
MPGSLQEETVEVLQRLLRINTVNPPGNERPAQEYLAALFERAGFEVSLVSRHMTPAQLGEPVHARDERIDVPDLALAVDCYRCVATELLG